MQNVYLIDGNRTPFIKAAGRPNHIPASDLGVAAAAPILARQPIQPEAVGEVIAGCVAPSADETNIGRVIGLRVGCGLKVPGWTVQRNCASGLQAIDSAVKDLAIGRHQIALAGGTEAMSRAPLIFCDEAVQWFAELNLAKVWHQKIAMLKKFRPKMLMPIISLLRGLTDPVVGMSMGQTAEKLAYEFSITRADMDNFAVMSHQKALKATEENRLADEMQPLVDWQGNAYETDNGIRTDSSAQKLAKLRPVFDKPFGTVTAGNSSQVTDGAAFMLLATEQAVEQHKLQPQAKVVDIAWAGLDPTIMGLGPAHAIAQLLTKNQLSLNDIDIIEINEAFAAQVIACVRALADAELCKRFLDFNEPFGEIEPTRLNPDGGAIALGHPVGASGARLTLHLMHALKHHQGKYGIATLCIGGGQGGAILIENL